MLAQNPSSLPVVSRHQPQQPEFLAQMPKPQFEIGIRVINCWFCDDQQDPENFGKNFMDQGWITGIRYAEDICANGVIEKHWVYLVYFDSLDNSYSEPRKAVELHEMDEETLFGYSE